MTNKQQYQPTTFQRLGTAELVVHDLFRSLTFYRDTLGLQVLEQTENQRVLTADGKLPLLMLREDKEAPHRPAQTTGLYHLAFLLPTRKELGCFLSFLLDNYLPVNGASDHLYSEAVYLTDPDGNGIEIYADRPASAWKRDANGDYIATIERLDIDDLLAEAGNKPWKGVPAATTMGHIHLSVSNLAEAEHFYHTIFGMDIMTRYKNEALFLAKDGYHHQVAVNVWHGQGLPPAPKNSLGLKQFTWYASEEEIKQIEAQCETYGYAYQKEGNTWTIEDPFGNTVCIVVSR